MAAPTTEFTNGTGTISSTAEANGLLLTVSPKVVNPRARIGFSGTFTGVTVAVRGSLRGVGATETGVYYPIPARNLTTGQDVANSGSIALTDSTPALFEFDASMCDTVEVYASAGTLTDFDVEARVEPASPGMTPPIIVSVAGQQTFAGNLTLASGADLVFSGTTGQNEVTVTDNLADALSVKVAGGNDLLVLDSTDSAEKVYVGGSQAGQEVFIRPGTVGPAVKRTATTVTTAGAGTYTAAAVLGGIILRDPTGGDRTDTTHTAAQLVAALPGVAVGDTVEVMIVNTADAAETITLAGGTNVTLVPATITIAQNEVFRGTLRFTNVTGSSEAATLYGGCVAG